MSDGGRHLWANPPAKYAWLDAAGIALQMRVTIRENKEINEKHKKVVDKCKNVCYDKAIKSKEEPTDG